MIVTTVILNLVGPESQSIYAVPWYWHFVLGGFAFGAMFMATDPVSASMTRTGMWIYGGLIGFIAILIRVVNPAFAEGVMLAILFGNVFAPVIDHFVVRSHIRKRKLRDSYE
jgi:Na+-transporting NADH:ubiquinone oxidoreductase subunit B